MAQQNVGVFVTSALPRAFRIAEVYVDIGDDSELAMIGEFGSSVGSQRRHHSLGKMANLSQQGADDAVAVLATNLDQHHEAGAALD